MDKITSKQLAKCILDYLPDWKYRFTLEELITIFTDWSTTEGFPRATKWSSLEKLEDELKELKESMIPPYTTHKPVEEYVDCIMCLLDSSRRYGISTKELVEAFKLKLETNMRRKWKKNENNTYSHE